MSDEVVSQLTAPVIPSVGLGVGMRLGRSITPVNEESKSDK